MKLRLAVPPLTCPFASTSRECERIISAKRKTAHFPQCQDWQISENDMEPMSPNEGFQVEWGEAGPPGQILAATAIRYATSRSQRFALSVSPMGEAVDYERAEQLVQVVLWHQAYSPMIAYVGVKSSKGGELGPELFIQQLESENRWREEQGFCLQGLALFYFSHVKLAEFSCSGCFLSDLIWLLSSSLLPTPLFIFLVSF